MKIEEQLDEIIAKTIEAIARSKAEIFEIAESLRASHTRLEGQLDEVKRAVLNIIEQVDAKDREFRLTRLHLMRVSADFSKEAEQIIKQAYHDAQQAQLELAVLQEREQLLRLQRDDLELSLRNLLQTVKKAENLAANVDVAMQFLSGQCGLEGQLTELQERHRLGIRILKAREEEKSRLARDIHDGPAQALASAVFRVEICERLLLEDVGQTGHDLGQLKELIRATLTDIRKIIYNLRPMTLDDLGLVPTLRRFINDYADTCPTLIDFVVTGQAQRLPGHMEVGIFRIVQEALNNICQHAQARSALVRLDFGIGMIGVMIKDDGCGFDVAVAMGREGDQFGLLSMRERTQLLQGIWHLDSGAGRGTRITIRIPIKEAE